MTLNWFLSYKVIFLFFYANFPIRSSDNIQSMSGVKSTIFSIGKVHIIEMEYIDSLDQFINKIDKNYVYKHSPDCL